jgi:hypothetical protein
MHRFLTVAESNVGPKDDDSRQDQVECTRWTCAQVAQWLVSVGLEQLAEDFAQHRIDGSVLFDLDLTVIECRDVAVSQCRLCVVC